MELRADPGAAGDMSERVRERWRIRIARWIERRIPPAREVVLSHRNIFIIPNRQGLGFLFVLGLMFVGAINYQISLAIALVFLLLGMFVLSIFHTFRNLSGLRLVATAGAPVFAGERAEVTVLVRRQGNGVHETVVLGFPGTRRQTVDLIDRDEERAVLYVETHRRGWLDPGRLRIETIYPFGICRAWSLAALSFRCLVYPRPVECDLDWLLTRQDQHGGANLARGNDDYYGLREYRTGDSLRHVAWKIHARGQGMFTKEYATHMDERLWLRWDMFPDLDTEGRLSRLCWCVLRLDAMGLDYGLDIPGVRLPPARGADHYQRVLQSLALFGSAP